MVNKIFIAMATFILPFVFAVAVVYGQTPTTDNTTSNTTNDTINQTTNTTVPEGAPRTGYGYR